MEPPPEAFGENEPAPRGRVDVGAYLRLATRGAWLVLMVISLAAFSASVPLRYFQLVELRFAPGSDAELMRGVNPEGVRAALRELAITPDVYAALTVSLEVLFAVVFCLVALAIARSQADARWGMYISLTLVIFGTATLPTIHALTEVNPAFVSLDRTLYIVGWTLFGLFYYLFPDGRFPLPYTRALGVVWVVWQLSAAVFPGYPLDPLHWPPAFAIAVWLGWFATGLQVQAYRYLRLNTAVQRQQTKWVFFGWSVSFALASLINLPGVLHPELGSPGHPGALYELVRSPLAYLAVLIAPVSLGLAIVRYRLWDIDILINRTLVYIPLTALLAGLYAASVGLSQRLFIALTGERSDAAIVFTTLILATAFSSLRSRMQAFVDAHFREVPEPTRDLKALGKQVRRVVEVADRRQLAARFLREAVTALAAGSGAVYLWEGDRWQMVASHGEWDESESVIAVPLTVDGVPYGLLSLGRSLRGIEYSPVEQGALEETAGVVADAMRATGVAA